jgi:23S rRNA (pseudouridine1915-N3)-methyltransferase
MQITRLSKRDQKMSKFETDKKDMKVSLILVGKTDDSWIKEGIAVYSGRLKHYLPFNCVELPALKQARNLNPEQQKEKEGELILKACEGVDRVFLLDEKGKECGSVAFAALLQQQMNGSVKHLAFIIGGPYGFSEAVYNQFPGKISLSKMTFTHQMVRLLFTEQLYRGMTILKGEKYHHE